MPRPPALVPPEINKNAERGYGGGKRAPGERDGEEREAKRARLAELRARIGAEAEAAAAEGRRPEVTSWSVAGPQQSLVVTLQLGEFTFTGALLPRGAGGGGGAALSGAATGDLSSDWPAGGGGGGDERGGGGHGADSERDKLAERRAAVDAEVALLEATGPPPGTKCGLCHTDTLDEIPERLRGPGGRSQRGLGPMSLVRVSAVSHAWVHDQCARWSAEVTDPG